MLRGESANLLSVGAIDFGLIVDATVIMVESIFRRLGQLGESSAQGPRAAAPSPEGFSGKLLAVFQAGLDVNRSIFFAAGIIIAGFIPLFTLSGVEGHIFGPMAKTYAYALAGGLIATFTVTPALSAVLLPDHVRETETWVVRKLHGIYTPVLRYAIANKIQIFSGALILLAVSLCGGPLAGIGISAEAGRRQSLDSRHHAFDDFTGRRQQLRQPHAQSHSRVSGSRIRGLAAWPPG